jgi:hypothetical protein
VQQITLSEAQQQVLGACHAQVGASLLGMWGLPPSVVEAVALQHSTPPLSEGYCVRSALATAKALTSGDAPWGAGVLEPPVVRVDGDYWKALNAPIEWREVQGRLQRASQESSHD